MKPSNRIALCLVIAFVLTLLVLSGAGTSHLFG